MQTDPTATVTLLQSNHNRQLSISSSISRTFILALYIPYIIRPCHTGLAHKYVSQSGPNTLFLQSKASGLKS